MGSTLILVGNDFDAHLITGVSGGGGTWIQAEQGLFGSTGSVEMWYMLGATAGSVTITYTYSVAPAPGNAQVAVGELSGYGTFDTGRIDDERPLPRLQSPLLPSLPPWQEK
ncbi:MAG: hypothetical protein WDN27_04255 [Candidatus Saccharibacteria bacterium]